MDLDGFVRRIHEVIKRRILLNGDDVNHVLLSVFSIFESNTPTGGISIRVILIFKIGGDGNGSAILGTNRIGMLAIIPGDKIPGQVFRPVLEDIDDHPNKGHEGETGEEAGNRVGSRVFGSS